MKNAVYVKETLQYQKSASDQMFELFSLYQSSADDLVNKTLDQCTWLPENTKESYLTWSKNCSQTTEYFKSMIDAGFEQAAQNFPSPVRKENSKETSQPKQKSGAVPKKTTSKASTKKSSQSAQKTGATVIKQTAKGGVSAKSQSKQTTVVPTRAPESVKKAQPKSVPASTKATQTTIYTKDVASKGVSASPSTPSSEKPQASVSSSNPGKKPESRSAS